MDIIGYFLPNVTIKKIVLNVPFTQVDEVVVGGVRGEAADVEVGFTQLLRP